MRHYFFFFFFQAEDGIRDESVTGVQTCALPILNSSHTLISYAVFWSSGSEEHTYVLKSHSLHTRAPFRSKKKARERYESVLVSKMFSFPIRTPSHTLFCLAVFGII